MSILGETIILNSRRAFERCLQLDSSGAIIARLDGHVLRSHFQPILGRDGRPFAYEALLRVQDAQGHTIRPDRYLEQLPPDMRVNADRLARVIHLRNFVLSGATCQISLNMIPLTLIDDNENSGPFSLLLQRLQALEIEPSRIILEVVEHDAEQGDQALAAALQQAARAGIRIAVDDFGEQASTIERITTLHPQVIKIDRCMLLDYMAGARQMLEDVLHQGHQQGSFVIVEGIESLEQYQAMHHLGIDGFQGYFLGHPAPLPIVRERFALVSSGLTT